jgi:N-succinyldiaminopimelate aminotransferase
VRVRPGASSAETGADGVNPGARYIRVALVYDAATTEEGLNRLVQVLGDDDRVAAPAAAAAEG